MKLSLRFFQFFQRKKAVPFAGVLLLLVLLAWGAGRFYSRGGGPAPEEMLEQGLQKTSASTSFRYGAEVRYTGAGGAGADLYGRVEGERVAPDRVRMRGTIMNNPVEFVQVGDTSYIKDQESGRWISLPGNKLVDSELFYAELNPLAFFAFKDVPGIRYRGVEQVNGERFHALELRPSVSDPFLEMLLTDYTCKVWLSRDDHRLRQAVIRAKEKRGSGGTFEITLRFWDYDKNITINPPL
ncbi:MAG: hypothetical protein K6T80_01820 [Firmicutes bacterium]|nr:hypothetical protein [Bacillota bacterium]